MKKPTIDLEEEHGGIMLMLKIIEKISGMLEEGKDVNKEHLNKIVDFLRNFTDKCHHGKEEDILFPEMVSHGSNLPLINELLGEHKAGRDYIRGIGESLDSFRAGNPNAFHISVNMRGYVSLLTNHIQKENTVLFPLAEKELSQELQAKIEESFETLEREVIGAGKHEEYHALLKELKDIYLK